MNAMLKIKTKPNEIVWMTCIEENANKLADMLREYSEVKVFESGKVPFEELPEDVQESVKSTLKAYSETTVRYENKSWSECPAIILSASYSYDHFVAGYYKAKELYTEEERRQNFIEEFGYAPYRI